MKRIQYHQYGGPQVMCLEQFDLEKPGRGEVAVRVRFAAINPIDWKLRQGEMKLLTGRRFPRAMGMDMAGIVMSVGPGVTRFKLGDEVFGQARFKQCGALGEAVIASESALTHKPANIDFEQAACLASPGVTAWNALFDKGRLVAGQHVLINGCMGAVGEAAVQLARKHGIGVTGTCSAADMERARALGVEHVMDYRLADLAQLRERFDAVLDTAATLDTTVALALLKPGGMLLDLQPTPGKFFKSLFSRRLKMVVCTPGPENLERIGHAASIGELRLSIASEVPLSQAIGLIAAIEGGQRLRGKAVVRMG